MILLGLLLRLSWKLIYNHYKEKQYCVVRKKKFNSNLYRATSTLKISKILYTNLLKVKWLNNKETKKHKSRKYILRTKTQCVDITQIRYLSIYFGASLR